jgi:hypothetical protein
MNQTERTYDVCNPDRLLDDIFRTLAEEEWTSETVFDCFMAISTYKAVQSASAS